MIEPGIMTKQEISSQLTKLRVGRGELPKEGEGLTISALKRFLKYNNYKIYTAEMGVMSQQTQTELSRFFQRWYKGEIVFEYFKGDGWRVRYPQFPIPRDKLGQPKLKADLSFLHGEKR